MRKRLLTMLCLLCAVLIAAAVPAQERAAAEELPGVIAYGVYRPDPSSEWVNLGCLDEAGDVWLAERAAVSPQVPEEEIARIVMERRGMQQYENVLGDEYDGYELDAAWLKDMTYAAYAMPAQEGPPEETGAAAWQEAVYALRKTRDGGREPVLLGMAGRFLFENTDPAAQMMYRWMWRNLCLLEVFTSGAGYAAEGVEPHGFRTVSLQAFFKMKEGAADAAEITAAVTDCEEGPRDIELSDAARERIRKTVRLGIVTGIRTGMSVTGGTTVYVFRDAQGQLLGSMETYVLSSGEGTETLAVANDGMYSFVLLPEPVDSLPEEEQRLLSFTLMGRECMIGKTTPRELIADGWSCFPETAGPLTFSDAGDLYGFEARTPGGCLDAPFREITLEEADQMDQSYCGFDGVVNAADPEDPDTIWAGKLRERLRKEGEDPGDEPDPGEENEKNWEPLTEWLRQEMGGTETDYGVEVSLTLSDGRTLFISADDSPVYLLLKEAGQQPAEMEDES